MLHSNNQIIDTHVHFNTLSDSLLKYGAENNISYLSINTDIPFFSSIDEQEKTILKLKEEYGDRLDYVTTFTCNNWGKSNWLQSNIDRIKKSLDNGANGVKV